MNSLCSITFYDWLTENLDAFESGQGLFCPLHIALIIVMFLWFIALIVLAIKFPKFAKKFGAVLAITMVVLRIFRMIVQLASGKFTFVEVLPFQLCHMMCFLLAIIYFVKSTKFSLPVLCFAILGGVLTFIFGDYYYTNVPTFYIIESIILHFALPSVSICYICTRKPKYNAWSILEVPVVLAFMCAFASIGNAFYPERNYMYLVKNGLPFNFFPNAHFIFTYIIMAIIIVSIVLITWFIVKIIKQHISKNNIKNVEKNDVIW